MYNLINATEVKLLWLKLPDIANARQVQQVRVVFFP